MSQDDFERKWRRLYEHCKKTDDIQSLAFILRNAKNIPKEARKYISDILVNPKKDYGRPNSSLVRNNAIRQQFKLELTSKWVYEDGDFKPDKRSKTEIYLDLAETYNLSESSIRRIIRERI